LPGHVCYPLSKTKQHYVSTIKIDILLHILSENATPNLGLSFVRRVPLLLETQSTPTH
jgi:hypothetical protein